MNLQEYSDIFTQRGAAYHRAMQEHPEARNAEFQALFARRPVKAGETVLDIPAGGGYLARFLPPGTSVTELELTHGFTPHLRVVETYGDWGVAKFDHCVCLAALHHIADQNLFVSKLVAHARPGGTVHVADVDVSLPLSRFLDGFVGRFNQTGHQGNYLTVKSFLDLPGTIVVASEIRDCPWRFETDDAAIDFAADLFGLVDYPRDEFRTAVEGLVGIRTDDRGVRLDWRLRYIDLAVP